MMIYVIAASVIAAALVFFATRARTPDISGALRELLLARAEGKITTEEFEQRQAALHAVVLMPATEKFSPRSLLLPAVIVVAAAGLYAWLGNPQAINSPMHSPAMADPAASDAPSAAHIGEMNELVQRLAEKMARDPKHADGWALLGHSYVALGKHAEAVVAFAKAAALAPPDATLLADWADTYVMAHDRKWDKQSRDLIKRALAADPKHLKSLALAGSEAYDRADYKDAISYWSRMKALAPPDSTELKLADANIQDATALMTGKAPPAAETGSPAASGGAFIAGTVSLAANLKGKTSPTDTVFVVAKTPDGSGPPLAVKRYTVADLPVAFRLDESTSMVPGRNLSIVPQALLLARISRSGNAIPQPGDIQTAPALVKVGAGNVKLELSQ